MIQTCAGLLTDFYLKHRINKIDHPDSFQVDLKIRKTISIQNEYLSLIKF